MNLLRGGALKLFHMCWRVGDKVALPDFNLWEPWPDMHVVSCECPGCGTTVTAPVSLHSTSVFDPKRDHPET